MKIAAEISFAPAASQRPGERSVYGIFGFDPNEFLHPGRLWRGEPRPTGRSVMMRDQKSTSISIEACEADVLQYRIMRTAQILSLAAVAVSLGNNFGHFRQKPQLDADTRTDWRRNSGVDHHGHVVSLICVSVAVFGAVI